MRDTGLAVQDRAQIAKFPHHLALVHAFPWIVFVPLERSKPPNISHAGLDTLHVELVLQAYGDSVQRADRLLVCSVICVKSLGI
jgi:hypothetical protein